MIELNHALLASLMLSGYKYVLYIGKENHGLLHPLKSYAPDIVVETLQGWQLPIMEREIQDMADGEDLIDFKFYVEDSFFSET